MSKYSPIEPSINPQSIGLIITCGGTGKRFENASQNSDLAPLGVSEKKSMGSEKPFVCDPSGTGLPKQFYQVNGKSILQHSVERFFSISKAIGCCVTTSHESYVEPIKALVEKWQPPFKVLVVPGGKTRALSVKQGVLAVHAANRGIQHVLVHDGVRPNTSESVIRAVVNELNTYEGVVPGVPVTDTIKKLSENHTIQSSVERHQLTAIQTPQGVNLNRLMSIYSNHKNDDGVLETATDESSLLQHHGVTVKVVEGDKSNLKITTPDDLQLFKHYLSR